MDHALWNRIATSYREYLGDRVIAVAAFGSRARGTGHPDSDHDILLIVRGLPADPFERSVDLQTALDALDPKDALRVSVLARTPEEFLADVTPLHLDIALDAVVVFQNDGFLDHHIDRLRQRISEAGLERGADLFWRWQRPPRPDWAITWDEVRV